MAEKYGTIPKRFTKEWWSYFWEYYKIHTIVTIAIVIALSVTVYEKVTAPKYDLTIAYVDSQAIDIEKEENAIKTFSALTPDVNENGESLLDIYSLCFSLDNQMDEYTMAMHNKMQLTIAAEEIYLYIIDEAHLIGYAGTKIEDCPFEELSTWLKGDLKYKRYSVEGEDVAISLAGNSYLEKLGIDSENKYLCMRYYPRKDQNDQLKGYKGAIELANNILNNKE